MTDMKRSGLLLGGVRMPRKSMGLMKQAAQRSQMMPPQNNMQPRGTDTVPAMLTPGEAVIPREAAMNPKNQPAINGLINEGRQMQQGGYMKRGGMVGYYQGGANPLETLRKRKQVLQGIIGEPNSTEDQKNSARQELQAIEQQGRQIAAQQTQQIKRQGGFEQQNAQPGLTQGVNTPRPATPQAAPAAATGLAGQPMGPKPAPQPQHQTQMFGQPGVQDTQDPSAAHGQQRIAQGYNARQGEAPVKKEGFLDRLGAGLQRFTDGGEGSARHKFDRANALLGGQGFQGAQAVDQGHAARTAAANPQSKTDEATYRTILQGFGPEAAREYRQTGVLNPKYKRDPAAVQERRQIEQDKGEINRKNDFIDAAYESEKAAADISQVREELSGLDQGVLDKGLAGRGSALLRSAFGTETEFDRFHTRFAAVTNERVINSLPQGVASDRDIALAREGVPSKFANKEHLENWMRGVQKISEMKAAYDFFRADNAGKIAASKMKKAFENSDEYKALLKKWKEEDSESGNTERDSDVKKVFGRY